MITSVHMLVYADDPAATVTELAGPGVTFRGEAQEMGLGIGVRLAVPGADDMLLYQPHHKPAFQL